jgi:hypothetical protein
MHIEFENQEQKIQYIHYSKKCKIYCQKNGTDSKCALICEICCKYGHPTQYHDKIYCGYHDTTEHTYCRQKRK